MASAVLGVLIQAQDMASGVLKGIQGETEKSASKWSLLGAAMGGAAATGIGVLSDLAKAGAEDAASWQAVATAVEGAGAQLEDMQGKLSANQEGLQNLTQWMAVAEEQFASNWSEMQRLNEAIQAEDGATKESLARKKELETQLKQLTADHKDLAREYEKAKKELPELSQMVARQQSALESMSVSQEEAEEQLSNYLNTMRDMAAIGDDQMKPVLAGLISLTGDYQKSMELASLAADMARGKNISLQSAADLVGKVYQGNLGTLSRYGIVLGEGATATEALGILQQKFAGQAEAYGATTRGQLESLTMKIDDFKEDIGSTVNEVGPFIALLPGLSSGFSLAGSALVGFTPLLAPLAASITGTVVPALGAMVVALGPIGIAITALGAVVGVFALAWSQNWFDIQGKTQAVLGVLGPAFEGFRTMVLSIWEGLVTGIKANINAIIGAINGLFGFLNAISIPIPEISIPGTDIRLGGGFFEPFNLASIPYLASGGIAMRPTLAVIGDRGPEAVVPLNSRNGGIIDYDRLADAFARALDKRPTYRIDAHYQYQDERSLRNDISLLQMLGATT